MEKSKLGYYLRAIKGSEEAAMTMGTDPANCKLCAMMIGAFRPTAGRVVFDGVDITGMRPYHICGLGLARTFQIVRTLGDMTVEM